jgi:hypothetical protein
VEDCCFGVTSDKIDEPLIQFIFPNHEKPLSFRNNAFTADAGIVVRVESEVQPLWNGTRISCECNPITPTPISYAPIPGASVAPEILAIIVAAVLAVLSGVFCLATVIRRVYMHKKPQSENLVNNERGEQLDELMINDV